MTRRIVVPMALLVACGGEGAGGGGDDAADADADVDADSDTDADADTDADTGGTEEPGVESCVAQSDGSDCSVCACTNCFFELQACQADAGCVAIRECAQETGCIGIACYTDGHCTKVIDANGGPLGDSASLARDVSDCVEDAACPCGTASS